MGPGEGLSCDITLNTKLTLEQRKLYQDPLLIRRLLRDAKTVAIVGLSSNSQKASYFVANYLQHEGYRIIPVNPRAEGEILSEPVYPDLLAAGQALKEQGVSLDVVEIFRPPKEIPAVVDQAIEAGAKAVWMQLKLVDLDAAAKARRAGLEVVADRCLKIEHGRYAGTLAWGGMNTEIISARKAPYPKK
ncbi:MAG: CoA-binding protein [Verrucomicrobiota bacterium]